MSDAPFKHPGAELINELRVPVAIQTFSKAVKSQALLQSQNAVLWWPIFIATGIGLFFVLPVDPPGWSGLVTLFLAVAFWQGSAGRTGLKAVAFATVLVAAGFAAVLFRTNSVHAPILSEEYSPDIVYGVVVLVEPDAKANRVTLDRIDLNGLSVEETPERVRIRLPGSHGAPRIGERISVRAVLRPPGRPVAPGAFDFQRYSYFKRLGGVGFSVGQWRAENPAAEAEQRVTDRVTSLRAAVGDRLATALPRESGAVARALVTGERNAVPEELQEAYRQAGLAHMLAISGLHMSLLAGLIFVAMRYSLALIVRLAERFDTKKIAAAIAIGGALFYLILSGANVPAQRAFIMVFAVLFAVLIDRTALSLRTLAWAAVVMLLLQPEALVGASFQMSFAAVVALITVYERVHIRSRLRDNYGRFRPLHALLVYCAAILLTDLIATSATGPFTAFHFQRVPSYSLLANLLAGPIMGLWIMPWGLCALVLMPFGLEALALVPMGAGIDVVDAIARFVAGLPGSTWVIPPMDVWALVCVGLGGLFVCLWRGVGRWLGLVPLCVGLLQPWFTQPPHVLVNETAEIFAVQGVDGRLIFSPGRREGFTRGVWIEQWGQSIQRWNESAALACDSQGCVYDTLHGSVAISFNEAAVTEDCGRFAVMIAAVPSWRLCRTNNIVIDRFDVWRHGAHAVWLTEDGVRVERVSDDTGRRVWNRPTWRLPGSEN